MLTHWPSRRWTIYLNDTQNSAARVALGKQQRKYTCLHVLFLQGLSVWLFFFGYCMSLLYLYTHVSYWSSLFFNLVLYCVGNGTIPFSCEWQGMAPTWLDNNKPFSLTTQHMHHNCACDLSSYSWGNNKWQIKEHVTHTFMITAVYLPATVNPVPHFKRPSLVMTHRNHGLQRYVRRYRYTFLMLHGWSYGPATLDLREFYR